MKSITTEELKRIVAYDPETGVFTRLIDSATNAKAGSRADSVDGRGGYRKVKMNRISYKAHRLAFQYMTGREPAGCIDHINGDPSDNRFANLRESTLNGNAHNAKKRKDNTSGFKGVSWHKGVGKWTARIMVNNKHLNLGVFATPEAAYQAYCKAANDLHGEFARAA